MVVLLERANQEENNEYTDAESDHRDEREKHQIFEIEVCFELLFMKMNK